MLLDTYTAGTGPASYALLLGASMAFEFAYVGWARAASSGRPWVVTAYSIVTAALGLVGVGGALSLPYGWAPYLAGIGLGSWTSAYLAGRARIVPASYAQPVDGLAAP